MGLMLEEITRRKIEDCKRAVFTLSAYSDDFHPNNDEGCYTCTVRIFIEDNKLVGEYNRLFLIKDFNEKYYKNFVNKFCSNCDYREQFNAKNAIIEERAPGLIDEEIVEIIGELNNLGLNTQFSCQGTKDLWSDLPNKGDGHSVTAYITFVDKLPEQFTQLAKECRYLDIGSQSIQSRKRGFNTYFGECMLGIIDQWKQYCLQEIESLIKQVVLND